MIPLFPSSPTHSPTFDPTSGTHPFWSIFDSILSSTTLPLVKIMLWQRCSTRPTMYMNREIWIWKWVETAFKNWARHDSWWKAFGVVNFGLCSYWSCPSKAWERVSEWHQARAFRFPTWLSRKLRILLLLVFARLGVPVAYDFTKELDLFRDCHQLRANGLSVALMVQNVAEQICLDLLRAFWQSFLLCNVHHQIIFDSDLQNPTQFKYRRQPSNYFIKTTINFCLWLAENSGPVEFAKQNFAEIDFYRKI